MNDHDCLCARRNFFFDEFGVDAPGFSVDIDQDRFCARQNNRVRGNDESEIRNDDLIARLIAIHEEFGGEIDVRSEVMRLGETVETDMAAPRIRFGKISESRTQVTGASDSA